MTEEGEPFTQEEMDEFLSAAVDPDRGVVLYKDYVSVMAVEDTWSGCSRSCFYVIRFKTSLGNYTTQIVAATIITSFRPFASFLQKAFRYTFMFRTCYRNFLKSGDRKPLLHGGGDSLTLSWKKQKRIASLAKLNAGSCVSRQSLPSVLHLDTAGSRNNVGQAAIGNPSYFFDADLSQNYKRAKQMLWPVDTYPIGVPIAVRLVKDGWQTWKIQHVQPSKVSETKNTIKIVSTTNLWKRVVECFWKTPKTELPSFSNKCCWNRNFFLNHINFIKLYLLLPLNPSPLFFCFYIHYVLASSS